MGTLYLAFFYILVCIFTIKHTQAYTRCIKPDTSKTAYGYTCSSNSQCLTEYCNSTAKTCSCPSGSFIDRVSGLCVQNIGNSFTSYSGECGYLVSPSSMSTGSLDSWIINGVSGTYITIVVLLIDMDSTRCSTNYLEISEGYRNLLNKTCDRSDGTLRFHASISSRMTVWYRKPSSAYRGFIAIYYTRSSSSELYESMGYIVSPGYPVSYENYMNRTWLISAWSGRIIRATFLGETESCCDHVKVYDGRDLHSSLLANFSGPVSEISLISSANYMFVQFTTDQSALRTGFRAIYEIFVLYGYSCSSSEACVAGLNCIGNTCTCLSYQYYDSSTKTCKMRLGHGNICTTTTMCASGLTCSNGHCECTSIQYYNSSNGHCNSRLSFGSKCPFAEECLQGLVCRDSVCRCSTSQYYDTSANICKSGVSFGNNCNGVNCVQGLFCYSGLCSCSSSQYYDHSFRICKSRITYGNICNSTDQCVSGLTCYGARCGCLTTHYYNNSLSSCILRFTYGSYCTYTNQCRQDLECTGFTCKCFSNSYYNNQTCLAKLSHAVNCSTTEQCLTPYVCSHEKYFTKTCLCPSNMFFNTWNCLHDSFVQAVVSNNSIVKIDSILLKWTTQTWKSIFFFTVGWDRNTFYPNSSEYYVDGLSPGRTYNFTITTNIPADNYYYHRSVESKVSLATKQAPGFACSNYFKCSDEAICINGVCVCSDQINLSTLSFACKQHNTSEDNNTVYIAVAVVGWVAALAAVIAVFVVCSRNRKKSSTNGSLETQTITAMSEVRGSNDSTVPPKNDYKAFPTSTDAQATISTPDVSQVQTTVPALRKSNIKPSSKPAASDKTTKPSILAQPSIGHVNRTYRPDSPDNDEGTYEEISHIGHASEDDSDQLYQNVQVPKENEYCNSNI